MLKMQRNMLFQLEPGFLLSLRPYTAANLGTPAAQRFAATPGSAGRGSGAGPSSAPPGLTKQGSGRGKVEVQVVEHISLAPLLKALGFNSLKAHLFQPLSSRWFQIDSACAPAARKGTSSRRRWRLSEPRRAGVHAAAPIHSSKAQEGEPEANGTAQTAGVWQRGARRGGGRRRRLQAGDAAQLVRRVVRL